MCNVISDYQKFALIDAKLTNNEKGNVFHTEKHYFWKKCKLIKDIFFFHGRQRIAQNVEERKVDVFSIAIWIAIFYRPVANKKILRQEPSWTSTMKIFVFLQKSAIVNVRLGSKYTSQLFFNEGFLPLQQLSVQLFTKVFLRKNNHKPFF